MCSASTDAPLSRPNSISAEASERRRGSASSECVERAVELDQLRVQLEDVAQAREAGAGVVDREPGAGSRMRADRDAEARVVLHRRVLGHLEDHVVHVRAVEQLEQLRAARP